MALTRKNWTLNSYTNATWTDLVAEPATVATFAITNTTAGAISVQARLEDAAAGLYTLLPAFDVPAAAADESGVRVFDLRSIVVTGTQAIQVQAAAAGIEFYAGGAVDV